MQIDGKTMMVGLLGWPVSHSFSPAMHNAAAAAAGLNLAYVPLPVRPDEVKTAVFGLAALGFRGANVTVPHKQAVMLWLDEIEAGAQAIGAVNTIIVERSEASTATTNAVAKAASLLGSARLIGHNTDWSGFLADLRDLDVAVEGRDCLVLGAGGSARAVAYGLAQAGGRVLVLARRLAQSAALVNDLAPFVPDGSLRERPLSDLPTITKGQTAPLIINTTPLGMTPNVETSVWPDELSLPTGSFVYDLVYNPQETKLMQQAKRAGCRAANGLGMLVQQGAVAFELWTAVSPDTTVMQQAITKKQPT